MPAKTDHPLMNMICVLTAVICGWLMLGWTPGLLMTANDGTSGTQPQLREFLRHHQSWNDSIYYFNASTGGNLGHDIAPILPFMEWLGYLGFSAFTIEMFQVFLIQFLLAYYCLQLISAFSTIYTSTNPPLTRSEVFLLTIIVAFSPFVAWRIWYGHELLLLGVLPLVISAALLSNTYANNGRLHPGNLMLAVFGLANTIPSGGQQTLIYGIIFGLPFFGAMIASYCQRDMKRAVKAISVTAGIIACSLALIAPRYASMISAAFSPDASRIAHNQIMTYSYITGNIGDWLGSLPLLWEWMPQTRDFFLYHEVNYGFGPLILFLVLSFSKRLGAIRHLTLALAFCVFLSIIFTNRILFSDAFIDAIPILKSFRVPHRSILVLMWIMYCVALFHLQQLWQSSAIPSQNAGKAPDASGHVDMRHLGSNRVSTFLIVVGVVAFFLMFMLKSMVLEVLLWVASLYLVYAFFRKQTLASPLKWLYLTLLAFTVLLSFNERQLQWVPRDVEQQWDQMEADIYSIAPELANPLNRARLKFAFDFSGGNTAFALGVSQAWGYAVPLHRYGQLVAALEGQPYHPGRHVFEFQDETAPHQVLKNLYNVSTELALNKNGQLVKQSDQSLPGPAWFPRRWHAVDDWQHLADELISHKDALLEFLMQNGLFLVDDGGPTLSQGEFANCYKRSISFSEMNQQTASLTLNIQKTDMETSDCLMVLSLNYSRKLLASDENGHELHLQPVFGSLTGVLIPHDVTKITLRGDPRIPAPIKVLPVAGSIMLLLLAAWLMPAYYRSYSHSH